MARRTGVVRTARRSPVVRFLARAGFAVNGLVHGVIGYLAIRIAFGASDHADPSGAFDQIASTPGGVVILWAVTIGLAALGVWLILGAFLLRPQDSRRRAARFAIETGKGVAYLALAAGAFAFVREGDSAGSGGTSSLSARLMAAPGGMLLIILVGIAVLAVGVYFVVKGIRRSFRDDIDVPSGAYGTVVVALGIWGYASKGVALSIVGILLVTAALTTDPAEATGLDGALRSLLTLPLGPAIVVAVGAGFVAYGIYCLVRARFARL